MKELVALSVLASMLAGCACDPEGEAAYLAGSRATECGFAGIDEDRTPVTDCLDEAVTTETQAYGGWAEMGRDSELRHWYVVRPDRTYRIFVDRDPSGGSGAGSLVTVSPCVGPPVRSDTGYWCEGEALEPYDLCD